MTRKQIIKKLKKEKAEKNPGIDHEIAKIQAKF